MTRFPAFATALAVHAAVFVAVIVLPVLAPEPLPEPGDPPGRLPSWPLLPRIALADSRLRATGTRVESPRRAPAPAIPFADGGARPAPALEQEGPPAHDVADVSIDLGPRGASMGDRSSSGGGSASSPSGPLPGAGDGSGGGPGPVRAGGHLRPPAKLHHVPPRYPELAIRARVAGTVTIDCLIDESGRVTSLRVLSGHPLLAPAAVEAVGQWVYSPTLLNGRAVAVLLTVSVHFELGR